MNKKFINLAYLLDRNLRKLLIGLLVLCIFPSLRIGAQSPEALRTSPNGFLPTLVLENSKNHKTKVLKLDMKVWYKLLGSNRYKKARVDWITDSTITFKYWDAENRTISRKDHASLKVRKGSGVTTVTGILIVGAGAVIIIGTIFTIIETGAVLLVVPAIIVPLVLVGAATAGGVALITPQGAANMKKTWSWTVRWSPVMESFESGDVISLKLNTGEQIEKMRIKKLDAKEIIGLQISRDELGHDVFRRRPILISDIVAIQKYEKPKPE